MLSLIQAFHVQNILFDKTLNIAPEDNLGRIKIITLMQINLSTMGNFFFQFLHKLILKC